MFICSSAIAVEYGVFQRQTANSPWIGGTSVILNDGDTFQVCQSRIQPDQVNYGVLLDIHNGVYGSEMYVDTSSVIVGPCTISVLSSETPNDGGSDDFIYLSYKIIRAAESAAPTDSKYTASLNADGTRLAIGEQQGTNTFTRVYEYNDVTDAWEQLGDSVE